MRKFPPLAFPPSPTALFNGPIQETAGPPFNLMIARFPGNNSEHPASSGWVMRLLQDRYRYDHLGDIIPYRRSTTPITVARNDTVMMAIAKECDYLLMIDSDMEPECEPGSLGFFQLAWKFMMARRQRERECPALGKFSDKAMDFGEYWDRFAPATIGAPYCGASPAQDVAVLRWRKTRGNDDPDSKMCLEVFSRNEAYERSGIEKVGAIGTGLILYDVRTFFYLPAPWFEYEYTDGYMTKLMSTEDVYQTRNAGLLGMPQYVAWDCWAGHWKPQLITKPNPITCDVASETLRTAMVSQLDSRKKIRFIHQDDQPTPSQNSTQCQIGTVLK